MQSAHRSRENTFFILFAAILVLATWSLGAGAAVIVDTLEDIGPDGSFVGSRTIGGVTVTISPTMGVMGARTYFSTSTVAFSGQGPNTPLTLANVSGDRFISTNDDTCVQTGICFDEAAPIVFEFSSAVAGFGLTTLDLLEVQALPTTYISLTAYDVADAVVATHTRLGPQGGWGDSGLDLDWLVTSALSDITKVVMSTNIAAREGEGYGIDDLVVITDVPEPSVLSLLLLGIAGIGFSRKKRLS